MGNLFIVATPIGNSNDISKRAIEVLTESDYILCEDTRNSSNLLKLLGIKNKLISYHKFNEIERTKEVINDLKNAKNVALITDAGTPCISDPGSVLIKECIKEKIDVFGIPGASAVITALSISGININNFAFYGFLDRKDSSQKEQLNIINKNDIETIVLYESPKRIIKTLENIYETMNNPYVVVLNDLTKKFERKYYGNVIDVLNELKNNNNYELGEYVIIISKNKIIQENKIKLSPEAILIDILVKEKCTLKDAIKLASQNKLYSKNEYYNASIKLKEML